MSLIQVIERLVFCLLAKLLKKSGKVMSFPNLLLSGGKKVKSLPSSPGGKGLCAKV